MAPDLKPGEILVEDLWEHFRIFHTRPRGIKERLLRYQKSVYEDFWALKGVSFHLEPGDSLAVIGANGSGKSTLLKCLTKILAPDRGQVHVGGKVATLLELGAGFHGDLTGRENIYLNGSILGMKRKDLDEAYERIVRYSGVAEFIDTPVRNYSSGMFVRLGFAVAVNVDPDVLLIDEILAVGDANFQTKCFERMHDFKRAGKTLVLVTHDVNSAASLCDRALLLDHGRVIAQGSSREVVDEYNQRINADQMSQEDESPVTMAARGKKRWGSGEAKILNVDVLDAEGRKVQNLLCGQEATLSHVIEFYDEVEAPVFGYILRSDDGRDLSMTNTQWLGVKTGNYTKGDRVEVRFCFRMNLLPGRYLFTVAVAYSTAVKWYDWWDECVSLHVVGSPGIHGVVDLGTRLEFELLDEAPVGEGRSIGEGQSVGEGG